MDQELFSTDMESFQIFNVQTRGNVDKAVRNPAAEKQKTAVAPKQEKLKV